ncbi:MULTISPECIES: phosphatase PAP2 family protein [unclassified Sphingomonas]|uniref:phosphatase PAP2 family protein n=1 Tax=unclassified Sphingomonas TaxID=196159 RepID=UPI002269FB28|nr:MULTISPECIES: phosphatase PAP2 family protein [unclassified Sphingomonas]
MKSLALLAIALATMAAAKEPKEVSLLAASDLDPALVLPPPPARDSVQAMAELAELRTAERTRTAAQAEAAKAEGEIKDASIFAAAIGPGFDLTRLPATARLMALVRATEKAVTARGKDEFRRPRPWVIDPRLATCKRSEGEPLSSYPSGHTTSAYAYAGTLARLFPDRAAPILARAARYAETRITCEQHFRSDVTAGEALGLLVAERLSGKPAFATAYAEAAAELRANRLIP